MTNKSGEPGALGKGVQARITQEREREERLSRIESALKFNMPPLSIDDQRWLYAQVTGEEIKTLKRCTKCNAEGVPCDVCMGVGYLERVD